MRARQTATLFTARAIPTQRGCKPAARERVPDGLDTCSTSAHTPTSCIRVAHSTHDRPGNVHARFFDRARFAPAGDHAFADRGRNARAPLPRLRRGVQGFLPGAGCCRCDTELDVAAGTLERAATSTACCPPARAERLRAL